MQVEVDGALRFGSAGSVARGLRAFDRLAYPEFFTSALWTVDGLVARCKTPFAIEPDCDFRDAFVALAQAAKEGAVHLRRDGEAGFVRNFRNVVDRKWWMLDVDPRKTVDRFGVDGPAHKMEWIQRMV